MSVTPIVRFTHQCKVVDKKKPKRKGKMKN